MQAVPYHRVAAAGQVAPDLMLAAGVGAHIQRRTIGYRIEVQQRDASARDAPVEGRIQHALRAVHGQRTCHGHPTLNEAVKEAALAVDGRAIHM